MKDIFVTVLLTVGVVASISVDHPTRELQSKELKASFSDFDKNGDDTIDIEELGKVMIAIGRNPSKSDLLAMVNEVDADGNGSVEFEEFLTMMTRKGEGFGEEMKQVFRVFDKDGNGLVDMQEMIGVLSRVGATWQEIVFLYADEFRAYSKDFKADWKVFLRIAHGKKHITTILAAIVFATYVPEGCKCLPKQMTARQYVDLNQIVNGMEIPSKAIDQTYSVDYDRLLAGGQQTYYTDQGDFHGSFVIDMKTNTMYTALNGQCIQSPAPPMPRCHKNDKSRDKSEDSGEFGPEYTRPFKDITVYTEPEKGFNGYGVTHLSLEKDTCAPVRISQELTFSLDNGIEVRQYMYVSSDDITLSAVPTLLEMPAACKD